MDIIISNSSNKAIYEQIVTQIKDKILTGELIQGEQLPSIRGLAKDLRISVITTKRAYEELEREKFIETIAGKGSYVSKRNNNLLQEEIYKKLETQLMNVINTSKYCNMSLEEIIKLLKYLYKEENDE